MKQNVKKNFFGQNKRYKKRPHHSFTFNFWFSYKLKHKIRLSNNVWDFPRFQFRFVLIFLFNKMHGLFDFKTS